MQGEKGGDFFEWVSQKNTTRTLHGEKPFIYRVRRERV